MCVVAAERRGGRGGYATPHCVPHSVPHALSRSHTYTHTVAQEEDINPELFFVPYIQSLASSYTPDLGGAVSELYITKAQLAAANSKR